MSRLHVSAERAGTIASLIVTWPEDADTADIEEAIKEAARRGVHAARDRTRTRQ